MACHVSVAARCHSLALRSSAGQLWELLVTGVKNMRMEGGEDSQELGREALSFAPTPGARKKPSASRKGSTPALYTSVLRRGVADDRALRLRKPGEIGLDGAPRGESGAGGFSDFSGVDGNGGGGGGFGGGGGGGAGGGCGATSPLVRRALSSGARA